MIAESDFTDKREIAVFGAAKFLLKHDPQGLLHIPEQFILEIHLSKERYRSLRKNIEKNKTSKISAYINLFGAKHFFSPRSDMKYGSNELDTIKFLNLSSDIENLSSLAGDIKERFDNSDGLTEYRATEFSVHLTSEIEGLEKLEETDEEDEFVDPDLFEDMKNAAKVAREDQRIRKITDGLEIVFWCLVVLIGLLGFIAYRLF